MLIVGLMAVSCDNKNEPTLESANGLVLNYGDPAADGCGWVIQVDKVIYSPVNLDTTFQQDSLKVAVVYQSLSSYSLCGWLTPGYREIKITSIKKK
jgi:hypothetical protein